jgi:hypothetical protein
VVTREGKEYGIAGAKFGIKSGMTMMLVLERLGEL